MPQQKTKFKAAVVKAKKLYKSGRYKTFADAVKAAYKSNGAKSRRKVGATKFIEQGETRHTKAKRIVKVSRTKKGTFKKFATVGGACPGAAYRYVVQQRLNSTLLALNSAESRLQQMKAAYKALPRGTQKTEAKRQIKAQARLVSTTKQELRMIKILLK